MLNPTKLLLIALISFFKNIRKTTSLTNANIFGNTQKYYYRLNMDFQKIHPITYALLDVVCNSYDQLNSKNYVGLVFLDFKIAFDYNSL